MDLQVLEYFLAVAEEENISHAAENLHITQPTLSRQLKDLETELGKQLFYRTNKRVVLSKDGILFRQKAEEILELYERAKNEMADTEEVSGDICIGSGEFESFGFMAERIAEFSRLYPLVKFHIQSGNAEEILEKTDRGVLDIAMILKSSSLAKYEVYDTGLREAWGVLVRNDHPLASKTAVRADDLRNEPLIVPDNPVLKGDLLEILGGESVRCGYTLVKNAILLAEKTGWVILCKQMEHDTGGGFVFIPLIPRRETPVMLVWKRKPVYSPAVTKFIETFVMQ